MNPIKETSADVICDRLMRPWGDETLSPCERTAYAVASLVIGLLTGFILHIAYNLTYYLALSTPQPQPLYTPPRPPQIQNPTFHSSQLPLWKPPPSTQRSEFDRSAGWQPLPLTTNTTPAPAPLPQRTLTKWGAFASPYAHTFSSDKRPEALSLQRAAHLKLAVPAGSDVPPLRVLAARVLIYRPHEVPKPSSEKWLLDEIFWSNTLPTFLSDAFLTSDHIKTSMDIWPKSPGLHTVYLSGCTHLKLPSDFFPHFEFTSINLNGVQLENPDVFAAALSIQKRLEELVLDYSQAVSCESFKDLLASCRSLTTLQIGVHSLESDLPPIESALLHLRIEIPSLTEPALRTLLLANPHLNDVILHTKGVVGHINFSLLAESNLKALSFMGIIVDSPAAPLKRIPASGKKTLVVYSDTATLFHDYQQARVINFDHEAYYQLLNRYKHDKTRLNLIIRKSMMQVSKYQYKTITLFGRIFAGRLTHLEMEEVLSILDPFSLDSETMQAAGYNMNLEIFLRAAVDFCGEKIEQTCDFWDDKRTMLLQFLLKHQDVFKTSSSLHAP